MEGVIYLTGVPRRRLMGAWRQSLRAHRTSRSHRGWKEERTAQPGGSRATRSHFHPLLAVAFPTLGRENFSEPADVSMGEAIADVNT